MHITYHTEYALGVVRIMWRLPYIWQPLDDLGPSGCEWIVPGSINWDGEPAW